VINNGRHIHVTIPSHAAIGSWNDLQRIRSATGREVKNPYDGEHVLELRGTEFFIGDLALNQSRTSSSARGDISRYWSIHSLELLLVCSAILIPEPEYRLAVVTGLPVETYNVANKKRVKDALDGHHQFKLNGVGRTSHVTITRVIMEGAGAVIAYGTTEDVRQGAIDVGGRTTDLFAADGQRPYLPFCKGRPLGVEMAADALSAQVKAQYGRPLTPTETRETFRAVAENRLPPKIYASGALVPNTYIAEWTLKALRSIGADIASFVSQIWNNSETGAVASDIARVILVGGGAYYFRRDIEAHVPHLFVPPIPEIANALGYAALASQVEPTATVAKARIP